MSEASPIPKLLKRTYSAALRSILQCKSLKGKHDYISLIRKQQLAADYTLRKYAFIVF